MRRSVAPALGARATYDRQVGARSEIGSVPAQFVAAVEQLSRAPVRPEVAVEEMPAPRRIAPHAHAIAGDVLLGDEEVATGRFILLHDPAGNDAWGGTFRCVTFARADVESSMADDPVLPAVGWSWLEDSLQHRGAEHELAGGSVTVVHTEGFGAMDESESTSQVEVRASWTPTSGVADHLGAWSDLLCALAGLPPLSPDVIALPRRRNAGPRSGQ